MNTKQIWTLCILFFRSTPNKPKELNLFVLFCSVFIISVSQHISQWSNMLIYLIRHYTCILFILCFSPWYLHALDFSPHMWFLVLSHRGGNWGDYYWPCHACNWHRRCGSSPEDMAGGADHDTGDRRGDEAWHSLVPTGHFKSRKSLLPSGKK